jgi:hypothetical protein
MEPEEKSNTEDPTIQEAEGLPTPKADDAVSKAKAAGVGIAEAKIISGPPGPNGR